MRATGRFLSAALLIALAGLTTLGTSGESRAQAPEPVKAKTKRVGEWLTVELPKSSRMSWRYELDEDAKRIYRRDEAAASKLEQEALRKWQDENRVALGGEYPKFFCFKAIAPGTGMLIFHRKEVNTEARKTIRVEATVVPAGRP
jgi:hypothetical protein